MARLAEQGLAVVLISHNLHDIFAVAHRITVLRLGYSIGVYEREKTTQQEVIGAITAGVADEGRGNRRTEQRGDRVTPQADDADTETDAVGARRERIRENVKSGNLGSWPVVVVLAIIVIYFGFTADNFFTAVNFNNIIVQMAGTTMLAYGVVFVLLIGEIDLSIGFVSGVAGIIVAQLLLPDSGHDSRHRPDPRIARDRARSCVRRDRPLPGLDRRTHRRSRLRRHARRALDLAGRDPEGAARSR